MSDVEVIRICAVVYVALCLVFALVRSYFDGLDGTYRPDGENWLVLLWPLMVLMVVVHGPFHLAHWLGERARKRAAAREANADTGHRRRQSDQSRAELLNPTPPTCSETGEKLT